MIKLFKISSTYKSYANDFFQQNNHLLQGSYQQALQAYFNDCFAWADFWKINLEASNLFNVSEVVFNNETLQKLWAVENNLTVDDNWMQQILFAQLDMFKPDVVFIQDIYHYAHWYENLKNKFPSVKLVMAWDGILWHNMQTYAHVDVVLSCVQQTVDFYNHQNKPAYYFVSGYETSISTKLQKRQLQNTSFTGSLVLAKGYHLGRLKFLAALSRKIPIEIYASNFESHSWTSKSFLSRIKHHKFQEAVDVYQITKYNKGPVFALQMYNILFNSKVVINTHGDNAANVAANMRLTEATGVGACLVTDWKPNLKDFFDPETEIVSYKNVDEAAEKIKYLLQNDHERNSIAAAGQKRTLQNYTMKIRLQQLIPNIIKHL